MTAAAADLRSADAALAVDLLAIAPFELGGVVVRGWPGPQRDALLAAVRSRLPPGAPMHRLPLHITADRLLGGLSLAATLSSGTLVSEAGLLAEADRGLVVVAMAERVEPMVSTALCAALDTGELRLERDGLTRQTPCRCGVVALDEGLEDERLPEALADRLAFRVELEGLELDWKPDPPAAATLDLARADWRQVEVSDEVVEALCEGALALGVLSLRAPVLAVTVARVHAALGRRRSVDALDAEVAARLVLGPRARQMPVDADPEESAASPEEESGPPAPPSAEPNDSPEPDRSEATAPAQPLEERVLEAAKSAIPAGLLDALALGQQRRGAPRRGGHAGEWRSAGESGRPKGVVAGLPQSGRRLNVVETLRAAAPWQALRRRDRARSGLPARSRLEIRKDDFRLTRFKQRAETSVIFCVDASGSAALQRLAEAKGAVEQVLADCYVRRDHVALLAFRGPPATLLLSPTRSLVRVRRSLADLAGGGTTPLAAGIDAALALALEARQRGQTPVLVLMTDGRANVARDKREGRAAAEADALLGARAVRAAGVRALFLDTAPRPGPSARALALQMGARYLPLPYLDAVGISREVQSLAGPPG